MRNTNPELEPVVAVCGNVAAVYGPKENNGIRPLMYRKTFPHYGAAKQFAHDFEEPANTRPAVR